MPTARSDAVRNRAAILDAAERLVARDGADRLRVAEVAREAGVGPGTLYRAFGSKSALLLALLGERERRLQDAIVRGRPPLGPGAPPGDRLVAFVLALHELTVRERAVLLAADEGAGLRRHRTGAHAAWRQHLALLVRQVRPDAAADVLAELLLAPLAASVQVHLLDNMHVPARRVRAEVRRLAELVAYPGRRPPTPQRASASSSA